MKGIKVGLLLILLSFKTVAQDAISFKKIHLELDFGLQSQISIGGVNDYGIKSDHVKTRTKKVLISPFLGVLITRNLNENASLSTGVKLSKLKTGMNFIYETPNIYLKKKIVNGRLLLTIPIIYMHKLNRKFRVGGGIEYVFDKNYDFRFSDSNENRGKGPTLYTKYKYVFGENYKYFNLLLQTEYKLRKKINLKFAMYLDTKARKAYDVTYDVEYNGIYEKYSYTHSPYLIRYCLGLNFKL